MDNPTSNQSFAGTRAHVFDSVPRSRGLLIYALAGLEAGIAGTLCMFACFVVAAVWNGGGVWSVPNLFSTIFYGDYVYEGEFLRSTWAGLALFIVLYGLMGAVWGCFWKENRRPLLSVYGVLTGLAVCFILFNFVWPHVNPLIPLYAPIRQLEVAHIMWGAALAGSPGYATRIAAATLPPVFKVPDYSGVSYSPTSASTPAAGRDEAESVSGELIQ